MSQLLPGRKNQWAWCIAGLLLLLLPVAAVSGDGEDKAAWVQGIWKPVAGQNPCGLLRISDHQFDWSRPAAGCGSQRYRVIEALPTLLIVSVGSGEVGFAVLISTPSGLSFRRCRDAEATWDASQACNPRYRGGAPFEDWVGDSYSPASEADWLADATPAPQARTLIFDPRLWLALLPLAILYYLPLIVAVRRGLRAERRVVFWVNTLVGWTGIGWLVLLGWVAGRSR